MLRCLYESRRLVALVGLVLWAVTSTTAIAISWPQLFAAMWAFALSLGFGIFLTDRFQMIEKRR